MNPEHRPEQITTPSSDWIMLASSQFILAYDYYGISRISGCVVYPVTEPMVGKRAESSGCQIWRNCNEPMKIHSLMDLLPDEVLDMINHTPGDRSIRGHVRNLARVIMPKELIGNSDGMKKWLDDNVGLVANVVKTESKIRVAVEEQPMQVVAAVARLGHIEVNYRRSTTESGMCCYTCDNEYSGSVRVPISVFDEGEDAVEEYVREHWCANGAGICDNYEYSRHECGDEDEQDAEIEISEAFDEFRGLDGQE